MNRWETLLTERGIKPTSNRILVVGQLASHHYPMSLGELEEALDTLEKSSILRVLNLLTDNHIVHTVEDGRGIVKYEICHSSHTGTDDDMHVHFYCERCRRIVCFEQIPVPSIPLPEGYTTHSVNYMIKGICPDCADE